MNIALVRGIYTDKEAGYAKDPSIMQGRVISSSYFENKRQMCGKDADQEACLLKA
jgi:hypothetical protein